MSEEHFPSVPLNVDMNWDDNKGPTIKKCINCYERLPDAEQSGSSYYHCGKCSYVSVGYTT